MNAPTFQENHVTHHHSTGGRKHCRSALLQLQTNLLAHRNRSASTLTLLLVHLPGRHNRQRHCTGWRPFKHSLRRGQHARHCFMRQLWWAEHMQSSSCCSLLRYHTDQNRRTTIYVWGGTTSSLLPLLCAQVLYNKARTEWRATPLAVIAQVQKVCIPASAPSSSFHCQA